MPTLHAISEPPVDIIISSPYQVKPGDSLKIFVSVANYDSLTESHEMSVLQLPFPQEENPIIVETLEVSDPFINVPIVLPVDSTLYSIGEASRQKESIGQELTQKMVTVDFSLDDIQPYLELEDNLKTFIDNNRYNTIIELPVPENIPDGAQYETTATVSYVKNREVKYFTKKISFTVTSTIPQRAVIVVVDGITKDAVYNYASNINPDGNIAQLINSGIKVDEAASIFPSITPAAHSSIFTGNYPENHGIPGMAWFDRYNEQSINYMDDWAIFKFASGLDDGVNEHLESSTIYEVIEADTPSKSTMASYEFINRGADHWQRPSPTMASDVLAMKIYAALPLSDTTRLARIIDNANDLDIHTMDNTLEYLEDNGAQDFMSLWFTGSDIISHAAGPGAVTSGDSIATVDTQIGELINKLEQLGVYHETVIVITADHGQTFVNDNAQAQITETELRSVLSSADYFWSEYETARNGGMAYIYIIDRDTQIWTDLPEMADLQPALDGFYNDDLPPGDSYLDFILYKCTDCGSDYRVYMGSGTSQTLEEFFSAPGMESEYPNAIERIQGLNNFGRGGDIILVADYSADGFINYFAEDLFAGEHGNLNPGDTFVPLIISGPGIPHKTLPSARTIDISPTIANLLGFTMGSTDGSVLPIQYLPLPGSIDSYVKHNMNDPSDGTYATTIEVGDIPKLGLTLDWIPYNNHDLNLKVINPSGIEYGIFGGITEEDGFTHTKSCSATACWLEEMTFNEPEPGTWTVKVYGLSMPPFEHRTFTLTSEILPLDSPTIPPGGVDFSSININYINTCAEEGGELSFVMKGEKANPGDPIVNLKDATDSAHEDFLVGLAIPNYKQFITLDIEFDENGYAIWLPDGKFRQTAKRVDPTFRKTNVANVMLDADIHLKEDQFVSDARFQVQGEINDAWEDIIRASPYWPELQSQGFNEYPMAWWRSAIIPGKIEVDGDGCEIFVKNMELDVEFEVMDNFLDLNGYNFNQEIIDHLNSKLKEHEEVVYAKQASVTQLTKDKINGDDPRYEELRGTLASLALAHWYKDLPGRKPQYENLIDSNDVTGLEADVYYDDDYWTSRVATSEFTHHCRFSSSTCTWNYAGGVVLGAVSPEVVASINEQVAGMIAETQKTSFVNDGDDYYYTSDIETEDPDLTVTALWPSKPEPAQDEQFDVTVAIKNEGQKDAGPFKVNLLDKFTHPDGYTVTKAIGEVSVTGLVSGGNELSSVSWTTGEVGSHEIHAEVDYGHAIIESSELNNQFSKSIEVFTKYPAVALLSPKSGESFLRDDMITFTANAYDPQDRTLSGASVIWTSDIDGQIGTGKSFSKSLSIGEHSITLTATDSDGNSVTEQISVVVNPSATPVASIVTPLDWQVFAQGETVYLQGTAEDEEDGQLSDESLTWTSSIDGVIGSGGSISISTLSPGDHIITLEAVDSTGVSDRAEVTVTVEYSTPTVLISSPLEGDEFFYHYNVDLIGSATDPHEELGENSLRWHSDVDGFLGYGTALSRSDLTEGYHTITLTATDKYGLSDTEQVKVRVHPPYPPVASMIFPTNGDVFSYGELISFRGKGSDTEDGTLSGNSLVWTSDIAGGLGIGTSPARSDLSVGVHSIMLTATDSMGLKNSVDVSITINPAAIIDAPIEGGVYSEEDSIVLKGSALGIAGGAFSWSSSIDGALGTGEEITVPGMTPGTHTITLEVEDGNTGLKGSASANIIVVGKKSVLIHSLSDGYTEKSLNFVGINESFLLNTFSDDYDSKTVTFNSAGSDTTTASIKIPKNAIISSATMDIYGLGVPTSELVLVDSCDDNPDWTYTEQDTHDSVSVDWNHLPYSEGTSAFSMQFEYLKNQAKGDYAQISRSFDLTGIDKIVADIRANGANDAGDAVTEILIDDTVRWSHSHDRYDKTYYDQEIDVSDFSGVHTFKLRTRALRDLRTWESSYSGIDNIRKVVSATTDELVLLDSCDNRGWTYTEQDTHDSVLVDWNSPPYSEGTGAFSMQFEYLKNQARGDYAQISRSIDLIGIDKIVVDIRANGANDRRQAITEVLIDDTVIWSHTHDNNDKTYYNQEIDVSDFSGVHTFKFRTKSLTALHTLESSYSGIDNIRRAVSSYPSNPSIDIGVDGGVEWTYDGVFFLYDQPAAAPSVFSFTSALQSLLSSCQADGNGDCTIPIKTTSDSAGRLTLSNLHIEYSKVGIPPDQILYLKVPKTAAVSPIANIGLIGLESDGSFPKNPSLDVGGDGDMQWSHSGVLKTTETTPDFPTEISDYLNNCQEDEENNCFVPLVLHSDESGIIKVKNINLQYQVLDLTPPKIKSVSTSPSPARPGETVTILAGVSDNVKVEGVTATFDDISYVDLIYNEETGLYGGSITAPSPGSHQLKVVARDQADLISTAEVQVLVKSVKSDLIVNIEDVSYSPIEPNEGETVTITGTVHNMGDIDANDFSVEFLVDGVSQSVNTLSVAAGSYGTVQFGWNAVYGGHEITIIADSTGLIQEYDETNNNANKEIFVADATPPEIGEITVTPNKPYPNDLLTMTAGATDNIKIGQVAAQIGSLTQILSYDAASGLYEGNIIAPSEPGAYPVIITAEDSSGITSSKQVPITVNPAEADLTLALAGISFTPSVMHDGEAAKIKAEIHNVGGTDANNFFADLLVDGTLMERKEVSILSGSSKKVEFAWNAVYGTHKFTIVTDSTDFITEKKETNNQIIIEDFILDASAPIINNIDFSPLSSREGEDLTITADITDNVGVSEVVAKINDADVPLGYNQISGLYEKTTTAPQAGTHLVNVKATDVTGLASSKQSPVEIRRIEPDLEITPSSVLISPLRPSEDDTITLNANIQNIGGGDAYNFNVEFLVDGATADTATISVNAGETGAVQFSWTAIYGEHDLAINVDSDNLIAEIDETNNKYTRTLFAADVTPPSVTGLITNQNGWTASAVHDVSWDSAYDKNGIERYEYLIDYGQWTSVEGLTGFTTPSLADGVHTIYVRATDKPGNVGPPATVNVFIDTTPPNTPVIKEWHAGTEWSQHESPYFSWSNPGDEGSGVSYYMASIDGQPPVNIGNDLFYHPTWETGIHTFKIYAVDALGQESGWSNEITVYIDTAPPSSPTVTSLTHPGGGWYAENIPVFTWEEPSDESGVSGYYYTVNTRESTIPDIMSWWTANNSVRIAERPGMRFTDEILPEGLPDGIWYFHIVSQDNAGNLGTEVAHYQINIDKTLPIVEAALTGTLGENDWYVSDVTVTLTAIDGTSGVAATYYSLDGGVEVEGTSLTIAEEGEHILTYYSVDNAGNVEEGKSVTFRLDTTPPTITIDSPKNTTYMDALVELNASADEPVDTWWFNLNGNETNETFIPGTIIEAAGGFNELVVYANDSAGNFNSSVVWFHLNRPPVVVTGGPYDGTEGVPMDFSGLGTYDLDNDTLTYTWDFGDGTSGSGPNPAHTYAEDGIYTVTLTVNDGYVSSSNITYANISDVDPVANFSVSPESGSEPLTVAFTGLSSSYDGIISHIWDFGDGSSSIKQNPLHEYRNGTYTITLTVHEVDGDFDATSIDITVEDLSPTADFTWSPQPQNEGSPVQFTDASSSYPDEIVSWMWDFGDGSIDTLQNTEHVYCDDDIYSASLSVTDEDGSQDLLSYAVTVINVAPTADAGIDQVVDVFDVVSFYGSAADPGCDTLAYVWDFGDGTSAAGENVAHAYNTVGTYSAVLNVKDGDGGEGSDAASITVNKRETHLVYSGDVSGQYSDAVTLKALLTDKDGGVANKPIMFTIGDQSATAVTDAGGFASASLTLTQKSGQYAVSAYFAEDEHYLSSTDMDAFKILKEETVLLYLGDTSEQYSDTADVSAVLLDVDAGLPPEEAIKGIGEKEVAFSIGAQSTYATTGADGDAASTIVIAQIPGTNYAVEAQFSGDDYYLPSSDTKAFYIAKEDTAVTYSGDISGQYSDTVTVEATLNDADTGIVVDDLYRGISGSITLSIGSHEISGITDAAGHFSGEITLNQASGQYTADVSFAGDEYYLPSSDIHAFEIQREDTVLKYTGDQSGQYSDTAVLRAVISEIDEETGDLSNKNIMFKLGTESVSGATDVNAGAATFMVLEQIPRNYTVEASFAGDEYYLPSSDTNAFEILKEDAVISDPSVSIVYSDSTEVGVAMLDDDGAGILHKEDEPKVLSLEYDNGSAWKPLDAEVLDANNGVVFYFIIPETLDEVPQEYGLRASFEGDARYNPASTLGVMNILKESTVLSDPSDQVLWTDYITLEVTLFDNDNETLLHQHDEPKSTYLDLNKGVETWYVMSEDALGSTNDSDYGLVLHFNISKLNLTDIAEAYELRARFDGDARYEGSMSRSCTLNASVDARLLWAIHETELLINATSDRAPLKYLNRSLEDMSGALYTCNHEEFYEHLKHASKNLRKAEKMGVQTDYIAEALIITARDKTAMAIVDAEELVGAEEKHVKKAWKHYYKALDKLFGQEDDDDDSDDGSDDNHADTFEEFKHAYKEAMKARAGWVPASYVAGLQGALGEVQRLINDTNDRKALKNLEKAEKELSEALNKLNETGEDRLGDSFDEIKDVVESLEKAEKYGANTTDIVGLLVENAADAVHQKITDAEGVVGYVPETEKAWREYDEGMAKINESDYRHSMDSFKSAVKHTGKALEKGCDDKDDDSEDEGSDDDGDSEDSWDLGSGEESGEQEDKEEEEVDEEHETDDSDSEHESDSKGKKEEYEKDEDKPDKPGKPDKEAPPEDSKNPGKGGGKDKPEEGGQ